MRKKLLLPVVAVVTASVFVGCGVLGLENGQDEAMKQKEIALGEKLYFDPLLSKNKTQSCATCHNPGHGFVDDRDNGVRGAGSLGDDGKSIGDRNAPTASYAKFSPDFHFNKEKGEYIGGQFWDGREPHLKGQAGGPPTNPVEMGIPSKKFMADRLEKSGMYNKLFKEIYGEDIFENSEKTYEMMAQAIGEFEKTEQFAPFDSKYDRFLRGEYDLTPLEDLGRSLFFSNNNTNCASCHMLKKEDAPRDTFTNYQYHNIGVPQNYELMEKNVVDPKTFVDHGLLQNPHVTDKKYDGKIKVPTLRNIAVTGPYMHNGVFQKLSTVVAFYDKYTNPQRTLNPETGASWDLPEVVVQEEDMKLLKQGKPFNDRKIKALVAFMNTLTDKKFEHLIPKDN
ncbi:MAG: methylamine utilization protein MauG [Campylobacterales bacterium]|nr:methylamine utilization protein MauG [Campylobacterales bacterium]